MKRIIFIFLMFTGISNIQAQLNRPCFNSFTNDDLFGVGVSANWAISDDFNNDGLDDIIVSHYSTIVVYLTSGNGQFSDTTYNISGTKQIGKGDFNNDGHLDIFLSQGTVLLNNSYGIFTSSGSFNNFVSQPVSSCTGDFNEDGNLDGALIGKFGAINVALGNGMGGFIASTGTLANTP